MKKYLPLNIVKLAIICVSLACLPGCPFASEPPSPNTVRELADRQLTRLLSRGKIASAAVAVIHDGEQRIFFYGEVKSGEGLAPDAETLYEIGSATKTFTAAALALLVMDGMVTLDTPAQDLLPPGTRVPALGERKITLGDLASHVSGLPSLPTNLGLGPATQDDPYAKYTVENLYEFLAEYELQQAPGEVFEYSNLGVALLGHALSLKTGQPYEQLIKTRLLDPLGLVDTAIALTPSQMARLAPPTSESLFSPLGFRPVPSTNWDLGIFAPAGALKSSLNDMVRYLKANMTPAGTVLESAAPMLFTPRFDAGDSMYMALGWHIMKDSGIIWHNGETGGYCSFLGFNPKTGDGVVILANTAAARHTDSAASNILNGLPGLP